MTTNTVTRRDFLKIFTVLAGAIAGSDPIATGQAILDVPVAVPDIWDGRWHTIRFINKAGMASVGIDRELYESAEVFNDISEITKSLDRIFTLGGKTIHQMLDGNSKEYVFVRFDFRSDRRDGSLYLDDLYYSGNITDYPELTSAGMNVIQVGCEYGELPISGAPAI